MLVCHIKDMVWAKYYRCMAILKHTAVFALFAVYIKGVGAIWMFHDVLQQYSHIIQINTPNGSNIVSWKNQVKLGFQST